MLVPSIKLTKATSSKIAGLIAKRLTELSNLSTATELIPVQDFVNSKWYEFGRDKHGSLVTPAVRWFEISPAYRYIYSSADGLTKGKRFAGMEIKVFDGSNLFASVVIPVGATCTEISSDFELTWKSGSTEFSFSIYSEDDSALVSYSMGSLAFFTLYETQNRDN